MKLWAIRLKPDQDLRLSLKEFAEVHQIQAGFILSAIGSLKKGVIRFANQSESAVLENEKFEILSLHGTLSLHGIHLHIAISDRTGKVMGGHLDNGCLIYTTAEVVLGEVPEVIFLRSPDEQTGYLELNIQSVQQPSGYPKEG